jgi:NADH:ubiquinone oxidoreductase subunit 6 (subunit J)
MRNLFYVFAILSAFLFVYSIVRINKQFTNSQLPSLSEVKGFEDVNKSNDEYTKLVEKFRGQIHTKKDKSAHNQTYYIWLSFLVTALTAGSTLVSSIQAAKKDTQDNPARLQKFAILIAILAFCATVSSFAASHFNDVKSEATKDAVELSTLRTQFYADYEKASAENKSTVIRSYDGRLD